MAPSGSKLIQVASNGSGIIEFGTDYIGLVIDCVYDYANATRVASVVFFAILLMMPMLLVLTIALEILANSGNFA